MIEARNLARHYGRIRAVDDVSFRVEPGEVLGFLGPNGAGKTTTMRMIAGFLPPSSGTATVAGHDVREQSLAARQALGYLPEGAPAWGEMSPRSLLEFVADIRKLSGPIRRQRLDDVVGRLGLEDVFDQPIETLSKGFKRRVGLAQALLHDPPALVLDEPTDGLDPNQKHEVRTLIQSMSGHKAIVISTHILEEVDAVCNRAIVIAHGRVVVDTTPALLRQRSRYFGAVTLTVADPVAVKGVLTGTAGVARVEIDPADGRVTALPEPGRAIFEPVRVRLADNNIAFDSIALEPGRLDEVFRTITTASAPAAAAETA